MGVGLPTVRASLDKQLWESIASKNILTAVCSDISKTAHSLISVIEKILHNVSYLDAGLSGGMC